MRVSSRSRWILAAAAFLGGLAACQTSNSTAGSTPTPPPPTLVPSKLADLSGTDFTVAMKIGGHRTGSTFDRYNIVSEHDIRAAITKTVAYVESLPIARNVVTHDGQQRTRTEPVQSTQRERPAN